MSSGFIEPGVADDLSPGTETLYRTTTLWKRVIVTPAVYLSFYKLLHIHIQSTGQKSLCVNKFSLHHKAMFLLNSRIPLVRFSSESIVAGVRILSFPGSPI